MPDYTLSVKITGDDSGLQKSVQNSEKAISGFSQKTKSLSGTLNEISGKFAKTGAALTLGITTPIALAGKSMDSISEKFKTLNDGFTIMKGVMANLVASGIQKVGSAMSSLGNSVIGYQSDMETYTASFETMTGSMEKAQEIMQQIQKLGAETPFDVPQLAEVTQLLMNYGLTAEDALGKMQQLGDISQGSADKLMRIATAYGQMSSAGKVALEDIKQMIEAGFNPLQEISQTTGESMSSLYDRISDGTLSVDEITASMQRSTSEGGKYFQSMDRQSQTLSGQLSTLKDNINSSLGTALSGVFDIITKDLLPAINDGLNSINWKALSEPISNIFTAIINFVGFVIDNFNVIGPIIAGIGAAFAAWKIGSILTPLISSIIQLPALFSSMSAATNTAAGAQRGLNAAMSANPIVGVITLISGLITMLVTLWNTNEGFRNAITTIWNGIKDIFAGVRDFILSVFDTIVNAISSAIDVIANIVGSVAGFFQSAFSAAANVVRTIIGGIQSFFVGFINAVESAWNGLTTFVGGIFDGIAAGFNALVNGVKSVINVVIGAINGAIWVINLIPGVNIPDIPYLLHGTDDWQGGFAVMNEGGRGELVNLPNGSQVIPHDVSQKYAKEAAKRNNAPRYTDFSGILEGITIQVISQTTVDGTPLKQTAADYTIRKIGEQQRAEYRSKGRRYAYGV